MATEGKLVFEWVEILEPETHRPMYANVTTGDCRWDPPPDIPFKKCHAGQWWQLHDASTSRDYYFNVAQNITSWQRPKDGDVIQLSKLQEMQEELARAENDLPSSSTKTSDGAPESTTATGKITSSATTTTTTTETVHPVATPVVAQQAATTNAALSNGNGVGATPISTPAAETSSSSSSSSAAAAATASNVPPAPAMPQSLTTQRLMPKGEDLEKYKENLSVHKKGLFRKRVSLATMLSWSKDAIHKPMLTTHNKKNKKEALELFKNVQVYMNDRPNKGREPNQVSLEIVVKCWSSTPLRDELYIQLCKQTTNNRSTSGCETGWELLTICLTFFPPSNKFFTYLQGYISKHTMGTQQGDILRLAEHALKKLDRIRKSGAKRGRQEPSLEEVEHAKHVLFHPSVFGSTLDEIMEAQAQKHPDLPVPYVVKVLSDAVLTHGGTRTEGIFRVPGDIDSVNMLKVAIDREQVDVSALNDPHVPASTLKLWFRELYEPLIPSSLYDECIASHEDAQRCINVMDMLPKHNRSLVLFIVRFLQIVGQPDNQAITKMNYQNLSMVWAPNFLRCSEDDPMIVFSMTKKEMEFVRHLILHLNTDEVAYLFT